MLIITRGENPVRQVCDSNSYLIIQAEKLSQRLRS